jgi:hypothetical protein
VEAGAAGMARFPAPPPWNATRVLMSDPLRGPRPRKTSKKPFPRPGNPDGYPGLEVPGAGRQLIPYFFG